MTGVNLEYYIPKLFWFGLGHIATVARSVVLSIILAYLLTKTELGQIRYVIAVFGLLELFGIPGLRQIVTIAASKKEHATIRKIIKRSMIFSLIGGLAMLGYGIWIYLFQDSSLAWVIITSAGFLPISVYGYFGYSIVQAQENAKKFNAITAINALIVSALVLVLAFIHAEILWIILAIIGTDALYRAWVTKKELRSLTNANENQQTWNFGKVLGWSSVLNYIAFKMDIILLQFTHGFDAVSVYYIATALPDQLKALAEKLNIIMLPKMAKHDFSDKYKSSLFKNFIKFLFLSLLAIAIYYILAPFAFEWIYPKYPEAIFPSQIFMLSFVFIAGSVLLIYHQAQREIRAFKFYTLLTSITMIILCLILIPLYGIWGAVIARIATRIIGLGTNVIFFLIPNNQPVQTDDAG